MRTEIYLASHGEPKHLLDYYKPISMLCEGMVIELVRSKAIYRVLDFKLVFPEEDAPYYVVTVI